MVSLAEQETESNKNSFAKDLYRLVGFAEKKLVPF